VFDFWAVVEVASGIKEVHDIFVRETLVNVKLVNKFFLYETRKFITVFGRVHTEPFVNLSSENISLNRNVELLLHLLQDVGLEISPEKKMYSFMSRHRNSVIIVMYRWIEIWLI
jgi:hypothetical protein